MIAMIQVKEYIENEDGSATIVFDCDHKGKEVLIGEGLLSLLEKAIDRHNEDYNWTEGAVENETTRTEN